MNPPVDKTIKDRIKELVRLSSPIIVSRAGILLMVTADALMVGNFSSQELAYQAIGIAVILPFLLGSFGLIMGTMVVSSNAFGEGRFLECGAAWRRSILYSLFLGTIGALVGYFAEPLLLIFGQSQNLAKGGAEVTFLIGLGLPAHVLFLSTMLFLESIKRPFPAMILMVIANVVNIFLNYLFIYGVSYIPVMGASGAALATTLSRWILCIGIISYVWWMNEREYFGVRQKPFGNFESWRTQRRIGYASGLSIGIESLSFAILQIFAGWLGPLALSSYTIVFNLIALVFMIATGLGAATSVLVGIAYGRSDTDEISTSGWTGLGLNTIIMVIFGILFYWIPDTLVGFYSKDAKVISIAAPIVAFSALILVVDGGQAVMSYALRGRRDVWIPSMIQLISFLIIMVTISYLLAFVYGEGVLGLMKGVLLGAVISIMLHGARFQLLLFRDHIRNNARHNLE